MTAFTPEQEARVREIVAEMIGQFAAGADQRVRDVIAADAADRLASMPARIAKNRALFAQARAARAMERQS